MITPRRDKERLLVQRRRQVVRRSFDPQNRADPLADGFGTLVALDEIRLPPGAGIAALPLRAADVFTYVIEGALAQEDSTGRSGVIQAGEFQRMSTGRKIRYSERNGSQADWAHIVQLWLRPRVPDGHHPLEQQRFSSALRRGLLCLVASGDGRSGSLSLHQDAFIYSAILDPGQHVVHELWPERSAWVQVLRGEARIGDLVLVSGDGIGVTAELSVSITAMDGDETEILLLDLPPTAQALSSVMHHA